MSELWPGIPFKVSHYDVNVVDYRAKPIGYLDLQPWDLDIRYKNYNESKPKQHIKQNNRPT